MPYKVGKKSVAKLPGTELPPGEHYLLVDQTNGVPWLRMVQFYRTSGGREVATDTAGETLSKDGDLYRMIIDAVDRYDQEHPEPEIKGA